MDHEEFNELSSLALGQIHEILDDSRYQADSNFRIREIRHILGFVPDFERQIMTARRRLKKYVDEKNRCKASSMA